MKLAVLFFAWACVGCTRTPRDDTPTPPASAMPVFGDTTPAGRIAGRVVWPGAIPEATPIGGLIATRAGLRWGEKPNHMAPQIDPESKGLADAVVYLKGVEPGRSKPWPFAPLRLEQRDLTLGVKQGGRTGRTGFVRVGEPFEMESLDADYHMLRARGAASFTLPFPEPGQPLARAIGAPGLVEFTSAAGYFWSSAEVFACEHPYYTTTDTEGRFALTGVPPGAYTLAVWHRNWKLVHAERDPETGKIMRLNFDAPFRTERAIAVGDATAPDVLFTLPP